MIPLQMMVGRPPQGANTPIFVAAATSAASAGFMTSLDGINWTAVTTGALSGFNDICYSAERQLFAACGASSQLWTSPDAATWTQRTPASGSWRGIAWSPDAGLFVSVTPDSGSQQVMTSPNGVTWTLRTTPLDRAWECVRWVPFLGLFVAGAINGGVFGDTHRIMTSPDGINWTARTTGLLFGQAYQAYRLTYSGSIVCCCSRGNFGNMKSTDGISWPCASNAPITSGQSDVAFGAGIFVQRSVFADNGGWSTDGVSWSRTTATQGGEGLAFSEDLGVFVQVATAGTADHHAIYSTDGKSTWANGNTPPSANTTAYNVVCLGFI